MTRKGLLVLVCLCSGACAARHIAYLPTIHHRPGTCSAVVYVLDGAGGFRAASSHIRQALRHDPAVRVETVDWTHGYGRVISDQIDYDHAATQGRELAATIATQRQRAPTPRIHLIGHSAGCMVALAAAEALPPDSVDGIALLAPSVSSTYDLRPSLRAVRGHLDVYFSPRDRVLLGAAIVGTTDRTWDQGLAGRDGFCPVVDSAKEISLLKKLRQFAWHPSLGWTDNHGGHYGSYQIEHLRACVLPRLFECEQGHLPP